MPAFFNRPVHVRIEDDAVAHPDRHTVLDADVVSRRHLRRRELRARPLIRGERPLGDSAEENEGKNQQTEASQRTHRGAPFWMRTAERCARILEIERHFRTRHGVAWRSQGRLSDALRLHCRRATDEGSSVGFS